MARIQLRQAVWNPILIICLWHLTCFALVQFKVYLASGQPVSCHGITLFCEGPYVLFISEPISKYFPPTMEGKEESRQSPNPKDALQRCHSSRIPFKCTNWPVFSKTSRCLGENRALDIALLLFQHDNQTVQVVSLVAPWLTAKRSLIMKRPRR